MRKLPSGRVSRWWLFCQAGHGGAGDPDAGGAPGAVIGRDAEDDSFPAAPPRRKGRMALVANTGKVSTLRGIRFDAAHGRRSGQRAFP